MKLSEFKPTEEVLERAGKCTTAEELVALAREYDVELTTEEIAEILKSNSLKELNDEQLDQVAGGESKEDPAKHLPPDHGPMIGKYEAEGHIGERVYCVRDSSDTSQFGWGILERSYEKSNGLWQTVRVHNIRFEGCNHNTDQLYCALGETLGGGLIYGYKNIQVGQLFEDIVGNVCTLFLYNK